MPELNLDDGTLHYTCRGTGQPIILLHSLGGAGAMWKTTIDTLSPRFEVFALDARGHGLSTSTGEISVEQYARDATALVRHLDLQEFRLVGISMGAQAAMRVAAEFGRKVRKLVLADTLLGAGGVGAKERLAATRSRIEELGLNRFALEYTRSRTLPTTSEAVVAGFSSLVERTLPETFPLLQYSIASQSLHATASEIRAETLVLVGDQDISTPLERAKEIVASIAGSRLAVVPDANHLANLDNPDFFNAEVARFV